MDFIFFVILLVTMILSFFGLVTWFILFINFREAIARRYARWKNPHKYIESTIINDNGQLMVSNQEISIDSDFIIGKDRYIVDKEFVLYDKNKPQIFHFRGNPNPLDFKSHKKNIDVNSENYNELMKQKLIRDLLMENNLMLIILIVAIVGVVLGLVNAYLIYDGFEKLKNPVKK